MPDYCRVCGVELTDENWWSSHKARHDCICITCRKQYMEQYDKQYRKFHKEEKRQYDKQRYETHKREHKQYRETHKKERKQSNLKRLYNITLDQFNQMLKNQDNKCSICGKEFTKSNSPCVDHNHKTKRVRALLCSNCNAAIGFLQDDPLIIHNAEMYVRKYN